MSIRSVLSVLSYICKVIAAFMLHLLLFSIDGHTIRIEQYLPLHLGEMLCKLFHPGLVIDSETACNIDVLDSLFFWGLLLLPLYCYFWGRKVAIGYLCLTMPLLATLIWAVPI